VAQELHFYRLSNDLVDENGDSVDPLLIEKWFTPIEDQFSRNVANLLANGLADIPDQGTQVAIQVHRHPRAADPCHEKYDHRRERRIDESVRLKQ
jgi:hypothetical protein